LRPDAPERTICTKVRSIRALSTTRGKARANSSPSLRESTASSSAGTSFMPPRSRA
jgi:hypothetical protein